MILRELLEKADLLDIELINEDILKFSINNITTNSNKIEKGDIFIALEGRTTSGINFIKEVIKKGANVIISNYIHISFLKKQLEPNELGKVILVKDSFIVLNKLCEVFYNKLPTNIIAITGTNGKTSVSNMLGQILTSLNVNNIQIGTLGVYINGNQNSLEKNLTTPVVDDLYNILSKAKINDINYAILEASSEGLYQNRLIKNTISLAAFTNLSQDHLNFHKTMENYFKAKSELFLQILKKEGTAVINQDDHYGKKLIKLCQENNIKVLTYGKTGVDLTLLKVELYNLGYKIKFKYQNNIYNARLNVLGEFQVYNFLCVFLILLSLKIESINTLLKLALNIVSAKGRLELVTTYNEANIFIDYAHTPEALELVLKTLRKLDPKKLYLVFGCGGNRDTTKRAIMGNIASEYADFSYITDDNPRNENPTNIRNDIIKGFENKNKYECIPNRKEAITKAINNLKKGDILVIAGKGHEEVQIINNKSIPFKEKDIIYDITRKEK